MIERVDYSSDDDFEQAQRDAEQRAWEEEEYNHWLKREEYHRWLEEE